MSKKLLLLFVIVMLAVSLNESAPRVKDSNLNRLWRLLKRMQDENDPRDPCERGCGGDSECCDGWVCRNYKCQP